MRYRTDKSSLTPADDNIAFSKEFLNSLAYGHAAEIESCLELILTGDLITRLQFSIIDQLFQDIAYLDIERYETALINAGSLE